MQAVKVKWKWSEVGIKRKFEECFNTRTTRNIVRKKNLGI